jgi:cholesterol oxidase
MKPDYDVLVIGSGFGGSVTALRLTEKGYRVGVLEAGRRFADDEFAKTSWNLRKFRRRNSACTASSGSTCCAT